MSRRVGFCVSFLPGARVPCAGPATNSRSLRHWSVSGTSRAAAARQVTRACAPNVEDPPQTEDVEVGPGPMRWGRIPEGEKCTYCDDVQVVDCPVCDGVGYHGRTITCRYCQGRKRLPCPLCVEDDPYGWSYSGFDVEDDAVEADEAEAIEVLPEGETQSS